MATLNVHQYDRELNMKDGHEREKQTEEFVDRFYRRRPDHATASGGGKEVPV